MTYLTLHKLTSIYIDLCRLTPACINLHQIIAIYVNSCAWHQVLGSKYLVQVRGTTYLVPSTCYQLLPKTWYQVLCTKHMAPDIWYQVLGLLPSPRYQIRGTTHSVPWTWYPGLGTKYLVPSLRYHVLGAKSWHKLKRCTYIGKLFEQNQFPWLTM